MPNISGYLRAADNIIGNLQGCVVLLIILVLVICMLGVLFFAFFSVTNFLGISINAAGLLLIVLLGIAAIGLIAAMIHLGY